MRNRIWAVFLFATLFFLAMQWFVAPTPEDREFTGHLVMIFGTLTVVFSVLDTMGKGK